MTTFSMKDCLASLSHRRNKCIDFGLWNVDPFLNSCGINAKKSDTAIILKQWDNVPRKNFISVALGIHIPFDNDEICAKAMCNARPDQDGTPTPKKISFKYATVGKVHFSYGILEPCHNLDEL